ncbi:hypothetical protein COLO4_13695 [Corchorus olitorius]|uniref:RNase H type-1 domain-containing protein n=1 Tax=Corchorus olitorius TaxID=93759 RepID=A0A1R3JVW3_9ROSI|nr:hypothetical protein COLO4_13695 [Corchorus olitorius]
MVFNQTEVNAIKKIPVGSESTSDRLIWPFIRDGKYSVKSRYRLLTSEAISSGNNGQSSSSTQQNSTWRSLWNLKVAPKCGMEVESLEHILFFCPFAQAAWRASHFSYSSKSEGFISFLKWWEESANAIKARNSFLFKGRGGDPIEVWNHVMVEFVEYNEGLLNANKIHGMRPTQQAWQPLQKDFIKLINCDAAFDVTSGDAGLVDVAEAMALRLAVQVARDRGWRYVIFEFDNKDLLAAPTKRTDEIH